MRPKLLDIYCCAGGAAVGYRRAGFDVVGVDIFAQPRYPFPFIQADALQVLKAVGHLFDAVHASPPCQAYTPLGALHRHITYPDLLAPTRDALDELGLPYVIENVMAAPMRRDVVMCGGMFGLRTYRHRQFESNVKLTPREHPRHVIKTATKRRRELWGQGWHVSVTGDVGTYVGPEALGIDWMSGNELCQAIPPAYTEDIGRQLMTHLRG